ncbi:MAG TPA: molybdate ABC transporter substrate-binding protein [Spirochaetota bacterium]|nr:molybdate ABC transporter substrate-binding protein [Spirochaetota bacterium]
MKKDFIIFLVFLLCVTNFFGQSKKDSIIVATAAGMSIIFDEIKSDFEKKTGSKIEMVYSSSGNIREQIINGAPYDVFISANVSFVDVLIEKDLILSDSKNIYAKGRVILAVKKDKFVINDIFDLTKSDFKKIAIGETSTTPYGLAAKESLESLNLWKMVETKLIYAKDTPAVFTLLKTGNVEAAFLSLAYANDKEINYILIPEKYHKPINQALGIVKRTKNEKLSREFVNFVTKNCLDIFKKYGYEVP